MSAFLDEMGAPDWTYIVDNWSSEFLGWKMRGYAEWQGLKSKAQREAQRGRGA
jgi:hypothetical protein